MVQCKVCNKEFENNKGLSYHVSQIHKIKFCDYLVEHEYDGTWPVCSCGCGEKVNFFGGKFTKHVGNHGVIGLKRTAETRKKISEIQRCRKLTEEHKNKIKEGVNLRLSNDATISDKISQKLTGKRKSGQHCKNISEARKNKIATGEIIINREKISETITQRYLDGGFQWSVGQYTSIKTDATYNYRSSWEAEFMRILDAEPRVSTWNYEPLTIPYVYEGKTRRYIPDFLIVLDGEDVLVEVKPPSLIDTGLNEAKRQAALEFCQRNGWSYRHWNPGDVL
jgi:hypothetical protein